MNTNLFNFTSQSSFAIGTASEPVLMIDRENAALVVTTGDGDSTSFPLVAADGTTISRAVRLHHGTPEDAIEVGTQSFGRTPLYQEHFPLNEAEFNFNIEAAGGGHIGIIDIRDVGRVHSVGYHLHVAPVSLSIEGNYLVLTTVQRNDSDQGPEWYTIYE